MKAVSIFLFLTFLVAGVLLLTTAQAFGQASCMSQDEAKDVVKQINSPQIAAPAENKDLRNELLSMQEDYQKLEQKISDNTAENQKLIPDLNSLGEKNILRLCEMVKQYGWMRREMVGADGASAGLFLIRANREPKYHREIFPVVVAAAEKQYVAKGNLAWLIDAIRISSGQPQIFGTQTRIRDGIFYLYPLLSDAKVDEWRKLYSLTPLSDYVKYLQYQYQAIVLKSPRPTTVPTTAATPEAKTDKQENPVVPTTTANQILNLNEEEVIEKVDTKLVNLNVRVTAETTTTGVPTLQKEDFVILENDKEQDIEFFSTAETPFDLVLLLDLSGSTAGKQELIRKSTQRFIEAARPIDRIAIVTFTGDPEIVSDLTQDRQKLLKSIKNIKGEGGSGIWGAIKFAYEKVIKPQGEGRRNAILVMTDGVDSSLLSSGFLPPGYPTFMDLLETVRTGETSVIPIYLDTESQSDSYDRKAYPAAKRSLSMIADESGGQLYYARKVEDLNGVYEKIIGDLSRVYSLGYQPKDETLNGFWRKITVKLINHPDITARAKPGYYAK